MISLLTFLMNVVSRNIKTKIKTKVMNKIRIAKNTMAINNLWVYINRVQHLPEQLRGSLSDLRRFLKCVCMGAREVK